MRKMIPFGLLALSIHGHCQHLMEAPAFEVASITPCKPGTPEPMEEHMNTVQFLSPGGRFTARAMDVKFLIGWAFGILPAQISGGPSWIDSDRYDIAAKAETSATDDQMKQMTQTLLADRFHLKFHRETREAPVIVISLGHSAPKLYPPKEGETQSVRAEPRMGPDQKIVAFRVTATRFSLAQLNATFSRQLGRVILDRTGLQGDFDFSFELTPDEHVPNPMDPSILLTALREQLGLAVTSQKGPVEFLVIDGIEKVAAGN
jgi:uncharacterized protein (TIGR03435 family)